MIHDLPIILQWYLIISALGIIFLPLTHRLFSHFFDRGYILSKILGLLLISYTVWLLASLHIAPFNPTTIVIVLVGWIGVNVTIKLKCQSSENKPARQSLAQASAGGSSSNIQLHNNIFGLWHLDFGIWIFEELLLLTAFLFWVWVRGHEPSIHGLEKFMDYGFMKSIFNSSYFPPHDMWLSQSSDPRYAGGFFINYYYFGHYVTAFLSKLTSIPLSIGYNLMLAQIFAWCFAASFSIGANLVFLLKKARAQSTKLVNEQSNFYAQTIICGLLTAFLVTMSGNLHTIYTLTSGYQNDAPVPFWGIFKLIEPSAANPSIYTFLPGFLKYWYPNATRFIPNTIHEFPSYSWVVADLHGHVLDIPFVLLTIALLLAFITKVKQTTSNLRFNIYHLSFDIQILLLGLLSAVMFMTNAWDGAIYLGLTMLVIGASQLFTHPTIESRSEDQESKIKNQNHSETIGSFNFLTLFLHVALLILSFVLFSRPFTNSFQPFVHGVGVVGGWEIARALNIIPETAESVVKMGPLLLEKGNGLRSPIWMMGVLWGFFYVNVGIFIWLLIKNVRSLGFGHSLGQLGIKAIRNLSKVEIFVLLLILLSTALLIFPEFFYMKDIYPAHYRANTMFKLGYQAFIMLSMVSGFTILQLKERTTQEVKRFNVWTILFTFSLLLLTLVSIYPYFSIQSYYAPWKVNAFVRPYEGVDGIVWIKTAHPGDYETIQWFHKQLAEQKIMPQDVVLEGVGDSYTDYGRISSYTGLPTVLGWPVHEWLWRGSYDEPGKRVEEVRQVYEAANTAAAKTWLDKYQVKYIVIGSLEKEKYKNINEAVIATLGEEVFASEGTKVYKVK